MKMCTLSSLVAVLYALGVSCHHLNSRTNPEPQTVILDVGNISYCPSQTPQAFDSSRSYANSKSIQYDQGFPPPNIGTTPVTPPGKPYKGFFMPGFTVSGNANAPSQPNLAATSGRSQLITGGAPRLLVNSSTPYSSFDLLSAFVGCELSTLNGQLLSIVITCDYRLEARDGNGNLRAVKVIRYTPANPATVIVQLPGGLELPPRGFGNPLLAQPRLNVSFTEGCEPCSLCTGSNHCDGFKNTHELRFSLNGTTPEIPAGSQVLVAMDVDSVVVKPHLR